jgi:hypothetical protein
MKFYEVVRSSEDVQLDRMLLYLSARKKLNSSSSSTKLSKARTFTTGIGALLRGVRMMVSIIISADILVRAYRG